MARTNGTGHTVRDLLAWQKAMTTAVNVYRATGAFPRDERFGLVMQCRRAAVSIPASIAEGHGRRTPAYFVQFLRIAQGSASELDTELELAHRLGFLADDAWSALFEDLDHVGRLITNLTRSIKA